MGDSADDDARLVAAAQRQRAEFAVLYDKYLPRVYRYIVQRVGNHHDAEDLTAHVFMEAMDRLGGYREQGFFAAWLFTIAHHKIADHYRRRRGEVSLDSAGTLELESPNALPESGVVYNERLRLLSQSLKMLAQDKQEILALRFFASLQYKEIARTLGKSEAAIKMTAYRALDELRERMQAVEEGHHVPEE